MVRRSIKTEIVRRVCYACDSDKTYTNPKTGNIQWYGNYPIGWLCKSCNMRYITNPKWHPITSPIYDQLKVAFKGKRMYVDEPPRIGVCNWCRAVKPWDCRRTAIHHEFYDEMNPLKHALELCAKCHRRHHLTILA